MNYFDNLINNISIYNNIDYLLRNIINPFSQYFICDHFISDEVHKYKLNVSDKNDILKTKQINGIKNYDIIACQVNYFKYFHDKILPQLNVKIILITGQNHLPQINKCIESDNILLSDKILVWFAQNPIYIQSKKYIPFPYGIHHESLLLYANKLLKKPIDKSININHLYCKKTHKCRELLPIKTPMNQNQFYDEIIKSKFMLSPIGDRDDCFRHYECIGLGTIPISNLSKFYIPLFNNNMIYMNIEDMCKIYLNQTINKPYFIPNKNMIVSQYYYDIIINIKQNLINQIQSIKKPIKNNVLLKIIEKHK